MITLEQLLEDMVQRKASDLHITAGVPPEFRIDGSDHAVGVRGADARGHGAARLQRALGRAAQDVRDHEGAGLLVRHQGPVALPRQRVPAARRRVDGHPPDPVRDHVVREARPAASRCATSRTAHKGLVLVTGPTGSRQVDDARRDDRPHQQRRGRPHHDDRGPDRVHPPPQEVHRQPARGRRRHRRRSRPRSSTCCARTRT